MLTLLLLAISVKSHLRIHSPDSLASVIRVVPADFGNPFLYSRYGQLIIVNCSPDCIVPSNIQGNFALVYHTFPTLFLPEISIDLQQKGAIGVIICANLPLKDEAILTNKKSITNKLTIAYFAIPSEIAEKLKKFYNYSIWVSYTYSLNDMTFKNKFSIFLSGNYTDDKKIVSSFKYLYDQKPNDLKNFIISLENCTDCVNNMQQDCISPENICLSSTKEALGSRKAENTLVILGYFQTMLDNKGEFLNNLLNIYDACEKNYTSNCILSILDTENYKDLADTTQIISGSNIPKYMFTNENEFFYWPDYLNEALCIIFPMSFSSLCTQCSSTCSYEELKNPKCIEGCNSTECGHHRLICLEENYGCYNFMRNDNNCNINCYLEEDCKGECSLECLYSDLRKGLCPKKCNENCFSSYCSQDYCSPECKYSEIKNNYCPSGCPNYCCIDSDTINSQSDSTSLSKIVIISISLSG